MTKIAIVYLSRLEKLGYSIQNSSKGREWIIYCSIWARTSRSRFRVSVGSWLLNFQENFSFQYCEISCFWYSRGHEHVRRKRMCAACTGNIIFVLPIQRDTTLYTTYADTQVMPVHIRDIGSISLRRGVVKSRVRLSLTC